MYSPFNCAMKMCNMCLIEKPKKMKAVVAKAYIVLLKRNACNSNPVLSNFH